MRRCLASGRRIVHTAAVQAEEFGTEAPKKATDFAFGAVCAFVEGWIRARHEIPGQCGDWRNSRGTVLLNLGASATVGGVCGVTECPVG